jgi:hypothetical protein
VRKVRKLGQESSERPGMTRKVRNFINTGNYRNIRKVRKFWNVMQKGKVGKVRKGQ